VCCDIAGMSIASLSSCCCFWHFLLVVCLHVCVLAGDSSAFSALGRTAAELQQWPTAAAAYERSAELHAAVGEVEEQATELVLSGKHWLNAVAEVRQQQKVAAAAKDKHGRSSSSSSSSSKSKSSSTDGSSSSTDEPISWGVNVDKEQVRPLGRFQMLCPVCPVSVDTARLRDG
jgi:hypothetical protein